VKRVAALALALALVLPQPGASAGEPPDPGDVRPEIVWKKIPFGTARKRQTAAYSSRHYGERTYRLTDPRAIVEHYTAGTSFDSAWNHFAANGSHLGERPGVCAHFLIDTDGTIFQLVNLAIRCRHAIGMNWTAIGIEHVGTSARGILDNRAMMRASLRLTAWLMLRYDIDLGNVIGHAEILQSPYHRELYDDWRCSTHADWNRAEMRIYRRRLAETAERLGVPRGAGPRWVDAGC
jgi:beta-N-acetylhexosaminidase